MNTVTEALPHNPIQWRRALFGLYRLAKDTKRTDQVFEIISALTGSSLEPTFEEFIHSPHGQKLLAERPSLMKVLSDADRLRALPEGSLGRVYIDYMDRQGFTPEGLVAAQDMAKAADASLNFDADRQYVADRLRDMHDLWHVLTGYGMDDTGEIANLWFSFAQFGNPGMAFIALMGTLDGVWDPRFGWHRYCYRAFQRGRRAVRLVCAPIEDMLDLPIEEARKRLGISPPEQAHPEGIRFGYRANGELGARPEPRKAA
jgi:ubiquinone biosynthesis protein COQ4